ncbi:hypothetical protein SAMN04490247_3155 [Salimicrobium halophilum]|uniref:Uncharacterized protein n=1 Tax=Salimicrobium halophilum TaxID=86666 RepID=A0A1G8WE85_9BACI|nr:hypothetical protein SAMN04490247_3155 [Salimicrobium halophilum]
MDYTIIFLLGWIIGSLSGLTYSFKEKIEEDQK